MHMPELPSHSSLVDITSALPNTRKAWQDMMGLLTSRSFICNCRTKQHIDSKDSVYGLCCIPWTVTFEFSVHIDCSNGPHPRQLCGGATTIMQWGPDAA